MTDYKVQVDKEKYAGAGYLTPQRWSSYYLLVAEVLKLQPKSILEIGPGNGLLTDILKKFGYSVKTLDFDANIKPDYVMSVTDAKLKDLSKFDLVIAAQVLEHIKYADALNALKNLQHLTPKLLLTLPYTTSDAWVFNLILKIPGFKRIYKGFKIFYRRITHQFNGQHYWEIGKRGFQLSKVRYDIRASGWQIEREYLNPDNPFHYFFVLSSF